MKKRIAYPIAKFGMIIGMIIAYFSFAFAGRMGWEMQQEEYDVKTAKSQGDRISISLQYQGDGTDIMHALADEGVTEYLASVPVYADAEKAVCLMNIYLNMPDPFPFPLTEDVKTVKQAVSTGEPVVILGKGLQTHVLHEETGDYYVIHGQRYRVLSYVASERSASLDYVRILFYDSLLDNVKADVDYFAKATGLTVICQSDTVELRPFYFNKMESVGRLADQMVYSPVVDEDGYSVNTALVDYRKYAYLLYTFSLALILMVVELWILQRTKELAIRRAVGYSGFQIVKMIAMELGKLIAGIAGTLFLLQLVLYKIRPGLLYETWMHDLKVWFVFVVITFVILMVYPVLRIMTDSIASIVQDKGV